MGGFPSFRRAPEKAERFCCWKGDRSLPVNRRRPARFGRSDRFRRAVAREENEPQPGPHTTGPRPLLADARARCLCCTHCSRNVNFHSLTKIARQFRNCQAISVRRSLGGMLLVPATNSAHRACCARFVPARRRGLLGRPVQDTRGKLCEQSLWQAPAASGPAEQALWQAPGSVGPDNTVCTGETTGSARCRRRC